MGAKKREICANGHPLTADNIYTNADGWRYCRLCHLQRAAERRAEIKLATEQLNIKGYPGKWRTAKEMARNPCQYMDDRHLLPYWERARLFFLELGGEFIGQKYGERH